MPTNRKAPIERINQVSAMAPTSWIALLGYLAFIGVTLLGVVFYCRRDTGHVPKGGGRDHCRIRFATWAA